MREYDVERREWISSSAGPAQSNPRILKMLECYVQSYLQRRVQAAAVDTTTSPNL